MDRSSNSGVPRTLTERQVAGALGVEGLGRYDSLTLLLVFTRAEVERMAAQLGIRQRDFDGLAGERSERAIERIPEADAELLAGETEAKVTPATVRQTA